MAGADLAPARALVYRDVPIRDRGEMLSLTDMWRAAGADPSRQHAEWMRSAQAALVPVERRLASLEQSMPSQRKRPSARTAADLFSAAHSLGDRCPCCGVRHVTSPADGTRAIGAEIDHFFRNSHADPAHCWPICRAFTTT